MITIVSGLARCGSSMTMQMLYAGGMECCGCAPAFEDLRVNGLPADTSWLDRCDGMALKVLDPLTFRLPPGEYRIIWLDRDIKQQAKSWVKFMRKVGQIVPRSSTHKYRKLLQSRRDESLVYVTEMAQDVLFLRFERVLHNPMAEALRMAQFVGQDLDVMAMARTVVDRPVECLPYLLELNQLEERGWARVVIAGPHK